jgi:hypothetical protein
MYESNETYIALDKSFFWLTEIVVSDIRLVGKIDNIKYKKL